MGPLLHPLGMRQPTAFFAFSALLVLGVLACGGATTTNLFDSPPATTNGTDSTGDDDTQSQNDSGTTTKSDSGTSTADSGTTISETCGSTSCTGAALCCLSRAAQGKISLECATESDCNGVHFACDSADDCASGSQCCGTLSRGTLQTVACGTCPKTTNTVARICDPNASADECGNGTTCQFSSTLGYARCIR